MPFFMGIVSALAGLMLFEWFDRAFGSGAAQGAELLGGLILGTGAIFYWAYRREQRKAAVSDRN